MGVNVVYGVDGERFQVLLAVGSAPDVLVGASGWDVFTMGSAGALLSLDRYIQADTRWRHNDFMPVAFGNAVVDGVTYAMPTHLSGVIFFWNKDHFAEAGLDPAQPPAFDDLDNYHRRLTMQDNLGNITQIGSMPCTTAYDYANAILLWGYARGARSILEPGERAFSMTQTEMVDAGVAEAPLGRVPAGRGGDCARLVEPHRALLQREAEHGDGSAEPGAATAEAGGYEIGVAPPPSVLGENVTPVQRLSGRRPRLEPEPGDRLRVPSPHQRGSRRNLPVAQLHRGRPVVLALPLVGRLPGPPGPGGASGSSDGLLHHALAARSFRLQSDHLGAQMNELFNGSTGTPAAPFWRRSAS